jgi:ATP-dependent DNA helicase DinG
MTLPPPNLFGLPTKYTEWRPGQDDAVMAALESPKRVVGAVLPTGFGKSLMYMAVGHLSEARTVILTSTRALQHQLMTDFGEMDATLVQGQRSYLCDAMSPAGHLYPHFGKDRQQTVAVTVDQGPCHVGVDCHLKANGCSYYDVIRRALRSRIVITNYAWWFTLVNRPDIKLNPDLLVCDEAHEAPAALADALGAEIRRGDIIDFFADSELGRLPNAPDGWSHQEWSTWAKRGVSRLAQMLDGTEARTPEALRRLRRAQWLQRALQRIAAIDPALLLISDAQSHEASLRFDIVWAAPYTEDWLFRGAPKVLMTSATFAAHTATMLGVVPNDLDLFEAGDGFPVKRRPIYILTGPTVPKVDFRITAEAERLWIQEIDRLLEARADRKGIIHCVSYRRRDILITRSQHRARMMSHDRHNTADRIEVFKASKPGTVLVSPSVTTGYDFPYQECEFQILGKVPFPDQRDPVTIARTQIDSRYPMYLAMQEVIQAVGRGMRAPDDQCETLLVDKNFSWFLSKHADLAPRWFRKALRRSDVAPSPPPPLGASRP